MPGRAADLDQRFDEPAVPGCRWTNDDGGVAEPDDDTYRRIATWWSCLPPVDQQLVRANPNDLDPAVAKSLIEQGLPLTRTETGFGLPDEVRFYLDDQEVE